MDGKANTSHTHSIANVTNLQISLDGKANTSHTHVINDITNFNSQATLDTLTNNRTLNAGTIRTSNSNVVLNSHSSVPIQINSIDSPTFVYRVGQTNLSTVANFTSLVSPTSGNTIPSIAYAQYSNNFGTLLRTFTILNSNGNATIPGNIN